MIEFRVRWGSLASVGYKAQQSERFKALSRDQKWALMRNILAGRGKRCAR